MRETVYLIAIILYWPVHYCSPPTALPQTAVTTAASAGKLHFVDRTFGAIIMTVSCCSLRVDISVSVAKVCTMYLIGRQNTTTATTTITRPSCSRPCTEGASRPANSLRQVSSKSSSIDAALSQQLQLFSLHRRWRTPILVHSALSISLSLSLSLSALIVSLF